MASPLQKSYFEIVRDYCKSRHKSQYIHNKMLEIVGNYQTYRMQFTEIMNGLNNVMTTSKDCYALETAVGLLTDFANIGGNDVKQTWFGRITAIQNLKKFSSAHFLSCGKCQNVRETAVALETRFSARKAQEQKELCRFCKKTKKLLELPCGDKLCLKCLENKYKNDSSTKPMARKTEYFSCQLNGCLIPWEWVEETLGTKGGNASAKGNSSPQNNGNIFNVSPQVTDIGRVNCPKCGTFVYIYGEDASAFLVQCKSETCGFSFCQLCHREYHGFTDCLPEAQAMETEEVGLQQNDGNKIAFGFGEEAKEKPSTENCSEKLTKSDITPRPGGSSFGAMATKYELDFYETSGKGDSSANTAKDCFTPEEIAFAFSSSFSELKGVSSYPWDSPRHQGYKDYGRSYQSLQAGNWVEDEILEKAMKGFIQKEKIDELVGVLPSFLVNFSTRKNGNEFARILKEEKVLEKEILLSLVNTDMSGPGGHWILATIFLSKKTILLQDSSRVISSTFYQKFYFYLLHLLHVAYSSKAEEFIPSNWRLNFSLDSIQQENAYDCGPLAVANAYSNVMKNEQLDQRPKSASLRSWIHDCASNYKTPKDTELKAENGEPSKPEKQFSPNALKVKYEFIQGQKITKW